MSYLDDEELKIGGDGEEEEESEGEEGGSEENFHDLLDIDLEDVEEGEEEDLFGDEVKGLEEPEV